VKLVVEKTEKLGGTITAPPSKSHTHRALVIASLARGQSVIHNPLMCDDTAATIEACKMFGAKIEGENELHITGVDGQPGCSDSEVDVRGSGTTMRFMTAIYALCNGATNITGNESVQKRPITPLLDSLVDLGAGRAKSLNRDGNPPVCVGGKMSGGKTIIDGESSQFISALLLACPLTEKDSFIEVKGLKSRPYVNMTLEHLKRSRVMVWNDETDKLFIPGSQSYRPKDYTVPGDYSSAAFIRAAAAITDSKIVIAGLDEDDSQGDKEFERVMGEMMSGKEREIDLRDMPDLLPILAVMACNCDGTTILANVPHARKKESDRISAISNELRKMGAQIEELPDGLKIKKSILKGAELEGHKDHRIAMALAVAALAAEGRTIISDANAISKSYPNFVSDLAGLGANIRTVKG